MRKTLLHSLVLALLVGTSMHLSLAYAQDTATSDSTSTDADIDAEFADEEAPPPPEAPYPGSDAPAATPTPRPTTAPPANIERPIKTNDEGEYFYDPTVQKPTANPAPGTAAPLGTNEDGEFFYGKDDSKAQFSGNKAVEAPMQTNSEGEYFYPTETSPRKGSGSFRFGLLAAPAMENKESGVTFKDIYGDGDLPILLVDYEWQLTSKVGRLGLKFGSGLAFASGTGQFKSVNANRRPDDDPEEKFTFIMLPNQLTAIYRFQYADEQVLVPYVEGGLGYFTFTEIRDDDKPPKFGGSPVTVAAGGLNILLDWLDRGAIRRLDMDYGVNHVWLTGEYRVIVGLNKNLDFTSSVINAGFLMDF